MHEARMRWRPLAVTTILVIVTLTATNMWGPPGLAQGARFRWTPQRTIPAYGDETNPPILVADQNETVHAFASQSVGEDDPLLAITYNQWSPESGWTKPNDILLSPTKKQARLLDVFLDKQGVFHVIFFGGDEVEANLYYARAHAARAADALAWSLPEPIAESMVPPCGAISEDAEGNIIVMYCGRQEGNGIYVIRSNDRGGSWSEPTSIGPTYSEKLFPYAVQVVRSPDGRLHSIWQVVNVAGQGRGIFYSSDDADRKDWTNPVDLSEGEKTTELGTMTPALIAHDDVLFVLYNVYGKIVMRRSDDGGQRWDASKELFPQHGGVNGTLSLVEDSGNGLHLFFGQRITGNPDIHGMWHSKWLGANWSAPDPVVSGPQVVDMTGESGFDPYDASAVTVQGNTLLVTWRSDPGMKGNGVWYASGEVDAPALPISPLPTAIPAVAASSVPTEATFESVPTPVHFLDSLETASPDTPLQSKQPAIPVLVGMVPVGLLLVAVLAWSRRTSRFR